MGATSELFIQMQDEFVNTCNAIEEGNLDLLDGVINLRKQRVFYEEMASNIKTFESQYQEEIQQKAQDFGNEYKGVKFEFRKGGKTFDYKGIEEWKIASTNLKEIEDKYKSAWENAQKGNMSVTEDGEVLQLPQVNYRKDSMIIKLPKE